MSDKHQSEIVMYLIFREDLKLTKGKIAAQAGHAVQLMIQKIDVAYLDQCGPAGQFERYGSWCQGSMAKVALKVADGAALEELRVKLADARVWTATVTDEGRTCVEPGTETVMAIEPMPRDEIAPFVSSLKLY
jgi:PTH2 family peptidyl-tRNA hydrolase